MERKNENGQDLLRLSQSENTTYQGRHFQSVSSQWRRRLRTEQNSERKFQGAAEIHQAGTGKGNAQYTEERSGRGSRAESKKPVLSRYRKQQQVPKPSSLPPSVSQSHGGTALGGNPWPIPSRRLAAPTRSAPLWCTLAHIAESVNLRTTSARSPA